MMYHMHILDEMTVLDIQNFNILKCLLSRIEMNLFDRYCYANISDKTNHKYVNSVVEISNSINEAHMNSYIKIIINVYKQ